MFTKLAILALTTPLAMANAIGSARVVNNCDADVYVSSVGSTIVGPTKLTAKGGSFNETFVRDPVTGGKSLKVTAQADGLWSGAAQTVFAYTLDGDKVWYDLSDVFGDAFVGKKLAVASAEASCPSIVWPTGVPPAGSQVKSCTAEKDVALTLC